MQSGRLDTVMKSNAQLVNDIKSFLSFFYRVLCDYYQLAKIHDQVSKLGDSYFTQDNLSNFLCSLLFDSETVYSTLLRSYLTVDEEYLAMFAEIMERKQKQPIEMFDMADQFKLNEQSIKMQLRSGFDQPYHSAIQALKKIDHVHAPIQKLKVIANAQQEMDKCIEQFYEAHECVAKKYDTDQLLYIMVYIIVKSEVKYLPVYCKMMEQMLVKELMSGCAGYLVITI